MEQEKEGFSIPTQLKLLKDYAAVQGLGVAEEFVDAETAKQTGRASLGKMAACPRGIHRSARSWSRRRTGFTATSRTGSRSTSWTWRSISSKKAWRCRATRARRKSSCTTSPSQG
ncbi:MAG: hypothetical protein O7A68_11205 [Alphaproteobacteria bacterium]|nr:hypothetical protein [Alphaproteobacteria bacterium]